MSVFWEKGRRQLEDFSRAGKTPSVSGASPFNWYIKPSPAQMLRVSVALAFRRAVLKQVYTVLRGKDIDTGKIDKDRREGQGARLQQAQEKVLDLTNWHEFLQCLERAGFRGGKMISSDNAVLFSYALWLYVRVDYGVPMDRLREVIARWFFMAHATSRYAGTFETQFERDAAQFGDLPRGDADGFIQVLSKIIDDTLTADYWSITLPNALASSASKSPALLAYIAALNIMDADALLSTGKVRARLDPAITAKKGIERHHLFPRAYLRTNLKVTDGKEIKQIANMALVEWADNIAISDDAPDSYWPTQLTAKNLPTEMLQRQRYWHALPNGWPNLDYPTFLAQRRTLMAQVTRDAYRKLADPGYTPVYPAPNESAAQMKDSGRARHGTRLADLIAADLLPVGATLHACLRNVDAVATVLPDGKIAYASEIYDSPSAAGEVAASTSVNGWTFWLADTPAGSFTLAALRDKLADGV